MRFTREELYSIYRDISARVYDPYSSKFTEANTPFLSGTKKVNIEDMIDALAEAKIFYRDSDLPAVKRQPHTRLTVEPLLLGGQEGISALDGIDKQVGEEIIVNGVVVDNNAYVIGKKLTYLKTGIKNTFGQMCSELFVTSKITDPKLDVDLDPTDISEKGDLVVTPANGEMVSTRIVDIVQEFYSEKGFRPKIMIGRSVADQIIQEINTSYGKATPGDYKMVTNGDSGFNLQLSFMDVPLEIFQPVKEMGTGAKIDTSNLIQLYAPETLAVAYGVLEVFDEGLGRGKLIRGDLAVGMGEADKVYGRSSVHAFSAPLPVIVNNNLIERFNLVIA